MARINTQNQVILYTGAAVRIADAAWSSNVSRVFHVNQSGSGWISYKQGKEFSLVSRLEPAEFYVLVTVSATPDFELPGADIGPAVTTLEVTLDNIAPDLAAALASKVSVAQVQQLVTEQVVQAGGQVVLTPLTPAVLTGRLVWLDAADATTLDVDANQRVTAWRSKGDVLAQYTPITAAPVLTGQQVQFAASPMYSGAAIGIPPGFILLAVVQGLDWTQFMHIFCHKFGVLSMGSQNGGAYGVAKSQFVNAVNVPIAPSNARHLLVFSYDAASKRVRLGVDGGVGVFVVPDDSPTTSTTSLAVLGGDLQDGGNVAGALTGGLLELLCLNQMNMPLLRKLEGYVRVKYNLALPPAHPYATLPPYLEDTSVFDLTPQLV